ncbi:MAG: MFS transporter [Yoonia sp.]|uniref:MFS transporter n=1 Tax=Yoonia sp. TaxID=2212373 RepID=UPI003EF7FA13
MDTKAANRHLWFTLSRVTVVQIAATASVLALTALAPDVAADLGVGAYWIGYQVSFIYFAGLFASLSAGSLLATRSGEEIIALELVLLIFGLALLATAMPVLMLIASILFGVAYGINNPASSVILQKITPSARRSFIFSLKQTGVPLGAVMANVLLPMLALWVSGWQMAVFVLAVFPLAILIISIPHVRRDPKLAKQVKSGVFATALSEQRGVMANPALRTLAALGGLFSAMQLTVTAFAVVSLVEMGWSIPTAGLLGAALQIAGAVGRVGWGSAADRFGPFRILSFLGFAGGCLSLILYFQTSLPVPVLIVVFMGLGSCASGWNGVFLAAIAKSVKPDRVGAATGAILSYTFIGVMIGPSIFAATYHYLGSYPLCFALFSLPGFCGGILGAKRHISSKRAVPVAQ